MKEPVNDEQTLRTGAARQLREENHQSGAKPPGAHREAPPGAVGDGGAGWCWPGGWVKQFVVARGGLVAVGGGDGPG
jgi:hypothetical protein